MKMKIDKFSISRILRMKTPDLYWTLFKFLKDQHDVLSKSLDVKFQHDGENYLLLEQPNAQMMFVAHIDTVNYEGCGPVDLYVDPHGYIMNKHGVLGADDRAGVYGILEIYRKCMDAGLPLPSLLFTNYEETSPKGVRKLCREIDLHYQDNYKFFIELDRRGIDTYVTYNGSLPKEIKDYLTKDKGLEEEHGSYSDVCDLTDKYKVWSINMGCAYFKQHTPQEKLDYFGLEHVIDKAVEIYSEADAFPKIPYQKVTYKNNITTQSSVSTVDMEYDDDFGDDYYYPSKTKSKSKTIDHPNVKCPKCAFVEKDFVCQEYSAAYGGMVSRYECSACGLQYLLNPVKNVDGYNDVKPEHDRCTECSSSRLKLQLRKTKEGHTIPSYICDNCKTFIAAIPKTSVKPAKDVVSGQTDVVKAINPICPKCKCNSRVITDNYLINHSENHNVEATCGICGYRKIFKVPASIAEEFENFNSSVAAELIVASIKDATTRFTCDTCDEFMGYVVGSAEYGLCYGCGKKLPMKNLKKDKESTPAKTTVGDSNRQYTALYKVANKTYTEAKKHFQYGPEYRNLYVKTLRENCKDCLFKKQCLEAAISHKANDLLTCPIIMKSEYHIIAPEIFLEARSKAVV